MRKNKERRMSFFYIKSIILFLSLFVLKVNAETKIIAKNGATLYKLSQKYGVSLKALMHKNKFNDANKIIEGELIVIPSKKIVEDDNNIYKKNLKYKVVEGDTLYKIARIYNVNIKDIISINNFNDASFIKPNQIILLPKGTSYKIANIKKDTKLANKNVSYHQTYKNESITDILQIHNIKKDDIIALNKLNSPIKINSNTKLKIRENEYNKWLKYGSLTINWSDWTYLNNNYITQAKNKKNKPFLLALNCERRILNNTLENSYWTSWYFPENDFQFKLISDFCDQD